MAGSIEGSHYLSFSGARYALAIVATVTALGLTFATRHISPDPVFLFFVVPVAVSVGSWKS